MCLWVSYKKKLCSEEWIRIWSWIRILATRKLPPSKENIRHFKTRNYSTFSIFVGHFRPPRSGFILLKPMRSQIHNAAFIWSFNSFTFLDHVKISPPNRFSPIPLLVCFQDSKILRTTYPSNPQFLHFNSTGKHQTPANPILFFTAKLRRNLLSSRNSSFVNNFQLLDNFLISAMLFRKPEFFTQQFSKCGGGRGGYIYRPQNSVNLF